MYLLPSFFLLGASFVFVFIFVFVFVFVAWCCCRPGLSWLLFLLLAAMLAAALGAVIAVSDDSARRGWAVFNVCLLALNSGICVSCTFWSQRCTAKLSFRSFLFAFCPQAAKEAARDPSMVGDGVARLHKSRYDSISSYLHYCKRREENPMHVLEVTYPALAWLSHVAWFTSHGMLCLPASPCVGDSAQSHDTSWFNHCCTIGQQSNPALPTNRNSTPIYLDVQRYPLCRGQGRGELARRQRRRPCIGLSRGASFRTVRRGSVCCLCT